MNKVDPFFILIIVLVSGLAVTYKSAQYDLSGLKFQMLMNAQLKNKIKRLELVQKELEIAAQKNDRAQDVEERSLASVPSEGEKEVILDPAKLAEKMYHEAKTQCLKSKKNTNCLNQIEAVVTQFPGSKWAAESMILLAHVYIEEKRGDQAKELLKVVRVEFKKNRDIQKKLNLIENGQL
jgi:TolA-binding protein